MKEIKLTRGYVALVDDEDFELFGHLKWYAQRYEQKSCLKIYAARTTKFKKKKTLHFLHRMILNAPKNLLIDHIDGDGLNNQRNNLRLCTPMQNSQNRKSNKNSSSKYVGVHKSLQKGTYSLKGGSIITHIYGYKWEAQAKYKGKSIYLGSFDNEIDAAKARDRYVIKLFGEFANLNFKQ